MKKPHGGPRKGAGRKASGDGTAGTVQIRVSRAAARTLTRWARTNKTTVRAVVDLAVSHLPPTREGG